MFRTEFLVRAEYIINNTLDGVKFLWDLTYSFLLFQLKATRCLANLEVPHFRHELLYEVCNKLRFISVKILPSCSCKFQNSLLKWKKGVVIQQNPV